MEGNTLLLQVIRKMRSQINQLERENRALRGELRVCRQGTVPTGGGDGDMRNLAEDEERPAGSASALGGSITASPAPASSSQTDTTMTVRRYPTSSPPATAPSCTGPHWTNRPVSRGLSAQLTGEEEKGLEKTSANSRRHSSKVPLFQEQVSKCRSKVKAVSFLLPMDSSSCAKTLSPHRSPSSHNPNQLAPIAEKDL